MTPHTEPDKAINAQSVAAEWRSAMQIYLDSNLILLFMPKEPSESIDNTTVQLTWLRALDAALGGNADQGLKASCYKWNRDHASVFWRFILKHKALEKPTRHLFEKWTGLSLSTDELLEAELTERLLNVISKSDEPGAYYDEYMSAISDNFEDIIQTIEKASQRINRDGIDTVPKEIRKSLGSALSTLQLALSRGTSSAHSPEELLLEKEKTREWKSQKTKTLNIIKKR